MTANNRVVPENSKFDYGASFVSTSRFLRIDEVIREKLDAGKKLDVEDMMSLQ